MVSGEGPVGQRLLAISCIASQVDSAADIVVSGEVKGGSGIISRWVGDVGGELLYEAEEED